MILIIGIIYIYINYIISSKINIERLIYILILLTLFNNININNLILNEGLFLYNSLNNFHINFILIIFFLFLYINQFFFKKENLIIILSNIIGIIFLILSNDILMIFINIELINLSLYLLIGNFSSGIKYFLLSSIITTLFLIGITIIYSYYGNLNIDIILSMLHLKYAWYGFILFLFTLFFKLGLFPFHQWSPDLYAGISYKYMIYIQLIIKYGILILLFNIHFLFFLLNKLIIIISILTMLIASILITTQLNIQRFFALSSISHMGFLILQFSYSYLIYIYIYTISSLFLFSLFKDHHSNIFLKIFLTFLLFSLSGLPPLPGFYTKLYILIDLLNLGLYSVIIILLLSSIIITGNYIYLGLISFKLNSSYKLNSHSNLLALFFTLFFFFNILF